MDNGFPKGYAVAVISRLTDSGSSPCRHKVMTVLDGAGEMRSLVMGVHHLVLAPGIIYHPLTADNLLDAGLYFIGTRVRVHLLYRCLEEHPTVDAGVNAFLRDFPVVSRDHALDVLRLWPHYALLVDAVYRRLQQR